MKNQSPEVQKKAYANFRNAKIIEVLKIEVNEGEGVTGDPVRRVAYLVSKNGKLLAKIGEDVEREFVGSDEIINL
jgi:hypothetical protein